MSQSTRLGLPYLASGQAQKHVTINETLLRLDALVQLSAKSATTLVQPGSPSDGDLYLLPAGKAGAAWSAMANGAIAYHRDGVWEELTPNPGWRCNVEDETALYIRAASEWKRLIATADRKLLFTPGGDGVVSIYRIDTTRAQNPRAAVISSISGDAITLTTNDAGLFFSNALMKGVSYARIWNTSKSPNQSAWVKEQPANNQLKVVSSAALSGWTNGETIQIGDPASLIATRVIALDISPLMQNVLGRVFRQSGVLLRLQASAASALKAQLDASEAGASGSFQAVFSFTDGSLNSGQVTVPTSQLSPVSNSNLVFLRETVSGANFANAIASVIGVWV